MSKMKECNAENFARNFTFIIHFYIWQKLLSKAAMHSRNVLSFRPLSWRYWNVNANNGETCTCYSHLALFFHYRLRSYQSPFSFCFSWAVKWFTEFSRNQVSPLTSPLGSANSPYTIKMSSCNPPNNQFLSIQYLWWVCVQSTARCMWGNLMPKPLQMRSVTWWSLALIIIIGYMLT